MIIPFSLTFIGGLSFGLYHLNSKYNLKMRAIQKDWVSYCSSRFSLEAEPKIPSKSRAEIYENYKKKKDNCKTQKLQELGISIDEYDKWIKNYYKNE